MDHLDTAAIYALLDGTLPAAEARRAEAHLWRCATCRMLREECGAVVSALRWYGAEPPPPPEGYWERFWRQWDGAATAAAVRGSRLRRVAPGLALAASLALAVGLWSRGGERAGSIDTAAAILPALPPSVVAQGADWSEDYALFERMTVAVGGVDPLSKGVALAGLAESP